ncbi:MAG: M14 family zinc carboxypeptidase [Pseudobdellovibrionaceae bacterium]
MKSSASAQILTSVLGTTTWGLPLIAHHFNNGGPEVLILGGVHGDESEGVVAARGLLGHFIRHGFDYKLNLTLIPEFNPEGVLSQTRMNSRGVDLNRNLPTKDWSPEIKTPRYHPGAHPCSEPENQILVEWLEKQKPQLIVSLHSWHPMLNVNGDCEKFAAVIHKHTGYRIDKDIGYPTPGSLGTYAGLERPYPTLTYEIEDGLHEKSILDIHVPAILDALKVMETT